MNFDNIRGQRVDPLPFKNKIPPPDLRVQIALIEKAHSSNLPLVYRRQHDNILETETNHFKEQETYELLGELVEIDKQKKRLILKSENHIFYTYLVTVSSPAFLADFEQQREFSAAINSLINALRMKNKIPLSSVTTPSAESLALMQELKEKSRQAKISSSVSQKISSSHTSAPYNNPGKCLFEFQF